MVKPTTYQSQARHSITRTVNMVHRQDISSCRGNKVGMDPHLRFTVAVRVLARGTLCLRVVPLEHQCNNCQWEYSVTAWLMSHYHYCP